MVLLKSLLFRRYENLLIECIIIEHLAIWLAAQANSYRATMLNSIYGRLSLLLVQANARAFMARSNTATTMDLLEVRVVLCKVVCINKCIFCNDVYAYN